MPSTYTGLGTQLMATGEKAGTWGTLTNTNLQIIEQIAGGYVSIACNTTGATTLAVSDGAATDANQVAHRVIELTAALGGNITVTIPLDVQTFYIIKNSTTNAYTVEFKYVSGSGSSATWSTTDKGTKILYATANDGTNPDIVDVMATSSKITLVNNNPLVFNDADNSAAVTLDVPTAVSGSYTLTLPAAVGAAADYALTTSDGSGNTQWTATSTFGISTGKAIAMAMIFG
jgi:hypothetical protein|tara:strand:- start:410 stop:1102 length:693 start_codon:yes stop_codon:yes gene_type:complete